MGEQLEGLLKGEQSRSAGLEELKSLQEKKLQQEQDKLEEMTNKRKALDQELQVMIRL